MFYNSTQDKSKAVSSAQAIAQGISQDGGLFVPESFPQISDKLFEFLYGEVFTSVFGNST